MTDTYSTCGKQVLRNGQPFADSISEEAAQRTVAAFNRLEPRDEPTEQELIDIVSDAMMDVHDMDTGISDFAKAGVKALQKEGFL